VRRNRQRRRLREACRKLWPRISTESADLVVMALPPAEGCPFGALQRELEGLLTRAGLLSEPAARSPGAP
jgi:ribonuclease P protein component